MSTIVFHGKNTALACGLRWSVQAETGKTSKVNAAIRKASQTVDASRFAIDQCDDTSYLGLYTEGISASDIQNSSKKHKIHSLALVFINAMQQSSDVDRSLLYAILVATPPNDHQGETRAVIVIDAGRVVHDGIENRTRAVEIVHEYRARQIQFRVFCDTDEYENSTTIEWDELIDYADKSNICNKIPRNPARLLLIGLGFLSVSLYGAYHVLVVIPNKAEAEARRQAELDRTPIYLKALSQAMEQVGWSIPSLVSFTQNIKSMPYFYKGWALKTMECNAVACTETWERQGGLITELVQMRPESSYQSEDSKSDKTAVLHTPNKGEPMRLTNEMLTPSGTPLHMVLKPPLNVLENAGATGQIGESMTWPVMPMDGVKPDVVVKRTRVDLSYKLPHVSEAINSFPKNFVPETFSLSAAQGMTIVIKGFIYEK